jgi:hypothetical protein
MIAKLAFLVLNLGLVVAIAAELAVHDPTLGNTPEPQQSMSVVKARPAPAVDLERLAATISERPLFTPGRRRFVPVPVVVPAVESVAHEITARLTGVMIEPANREALFAPDGGKPFAAKLGDQVEGWTITSIEADGVMLDGPFGERRLRPTGSEHLASAKPNGAAQSVASALSSVARSLYQSSPGGTKLRLLAQAPAAPARPLKPNTGTAPTRIAPSRL